jgi:hypothetical protein
LDAPVSGGDIGARNAALAIMVGGKKEAFEQVMPLFKLMGQNIALMGGPGAGQHTKMSNQILIAGTMIGVCECLLYAVKEGLDQQAVIDIIGKGAAGSWSINNLGPRIVKGDFVTLREPGKKELKGVKVQGLTAYHDDAEGTKRGKVTLFRFEIGGIRFCHCGDLGQDLSDQQVQALGKVDVLFVPVGGVFTLDGAGAQRLVDRLQPKVVVPMHFRIGGLSLSIQTVDGFLAGIPENSVRRVGNEVELEKEDLPEDTEYWVFSP